MTKEFKMDFDAMGPYSDYMYNIVAKILHDVGPRAPCSPEERKAAELVQEELKLSSDEVHMEDFTCYPRAFLGWIRLDVFVLVVSFFIFLLTQFHAWIFAAICLAGGIFAALCFLKQFFKYEEWTPKFLPYKLGHSQNVVATFKPTEKVTKRVIYSGHLDSAFRFNLIHYTKAGYAFFFFGGVVVLVTFILIYLFQLISGLFSLTGTDFGTFLATFATWAVFIEPLLVAGIIVGASKSKKILGGAFRNLNNTAKGIMLVNSVYVVIMFIALFTTFVQVPSIYNAAILCVVFNVCPIVGLIFFASTKATPGAIDNLTAVAICLCMARILKEWRETYPEKYPKNTEVQIAIVGCEEVGLRGSEAFAKKHAQEYNQIDTTCVNAESISDAESVAIFTEEKTTGTKLTPDVYNLLDQCAKELDIPHTLEAMPGVAGGTDAAGLVRGGLKASSLCGLKYQDYLAYYHTDRDNLDVYNKERRPWSDHGTTWQNRNIRGALEQSLRICVRYLEKKDAK